MIEYYCPNCGANVLEKNSLCWCCKLVKANRDVQSRIANILTQLTLLKGCIETNETYIKDAGTKLAQLHSAYLNILAIIGE